MKYRIEFNGRTIGAIGIFYNIVLEVEAENELAARWKAYETHEHIAGGVDGVRVQLIEDKT